ncbi:hypothetical protein [Rhodomicrobium lacus]|uniref:hypothetical protein n=1 Tax=Rhodomicrobium lacus TaxID=2498452 RepID=UPI0026E3D8DC|nr:hypothetical protein [Rhodomicrobium lacus]WKW50436.1 hypothetical protein QMO75_14305 [Rhodomicrobium lacus]
MTLRPENAVSIEIALYEPVMSEIKTTSVRTATAARPTTRLIGIIVASTLLHEIKRPISKNG